MQFSGGRERRQDSGAAAGEEGRGQHQEGAEQIEKPDLAVEDGRDEAERDDTAYEVAGDHDAAAVEAVESDTGKWAGQDGGDGAGQHQSGDDGAGMRQSHGEAQDGDVVEMISDFADDLTYPSEAVVSIAAKQEEEIVHPAGTIPQSVMIWPR